MSVANSILELAEDTKKRKRKGAPPPKPGPVPQDVLDFFQKKKLKPSFSYKEVWAEEHATAFTVAKIMELSILRDVHASLAQAIEKGETLEQWKKNIRPSLDRSGWSSEVSDKAKPSRLRMIFETNMRVARAVGQDERAQETKKDLPYFIYELGPSKFHRDEHVAWDKLILPVDDPFWATHSPPLGYGCKCRRRQLTSREAENSGGVDKAPEEKQVKWKLPDGRTGTAPEGVHPTFAYPKTADGRANALDSALDAAENDREKAFYESIDDSVEMANRQGYYDEELDPKHVARCLSDGARRVLAELIELCPNEYDTTGLTKFTGSDVKTARKYIHGELEKAGLVGKRATQERLGLYPTALARRVISLLG